MFSFWAVNAFCTCFHFAALEARPNKCTVTARAVLTHQIYGVLVCDQFQIKSSLNYLHFVPETILCDRWWFQPAPRIRPMKTKSKQLERLHEIEIGVLAPIWVGHSYRHWIKRSSLSIQLCVRFCCCVFIASEENWAFFLGFFAVFCFRFNCNGNFGKKSKQTIFVFVIFFFCCWCGVALFHTFDSTNQFGPWVFRGQKCNASWKKIRKSIFKPKPPHNVRTRSIARAQIECERTRISGGKTKTNKNNGVSRVHLWLMRNEIGSTRSAFESDSRCGCCRNQLAPAFRPLHAWLLLLFFSQHCLVAAFLFIFLSLSVSLVDLWSRMFSFNGKFDTIAHFHQCIALSNLCLSLYRVIHLSLVFVGMSFYTIFHSKWNWYIGWKSGRQIEKHKTTCKSIDWPLILD